MKTLTICGSMRFKKQMKEIAFKLETEYGFNILQCTYNENDTELNYDAAENLVNAHLKKIDISDGIYVLNIDGYIGKSTKSEIKYAKEKGKEIVYHTNFYNK